MATWLFKLPADMGCIIAWPPLFTCTTSGVNFDILNPPGNALIGGGGGIGLIAGMSRLYPFPKYILLASIAITPLPLLFLTGRLPG